MRENGLNTRGRRKFIPAANSNHGLPVCENILNRQFQAGRGGEKRVSDITCLHTLAGWVYLTVVRGLYDRKVIGGTFSGGMEAVHTAVLAMEAAFANQKAKEGLIFHSDREYSIAQKAFGKPWLNFVSRFAGA
jgi:transposase InsO family protein